MTPEEAAEIVLKGQPFWELCRDCKGAGIRGVILLSVPCPKCESHGAHLPQEYVQARKLLGLPSIPIPKEIEVRAKAYGLGTVDEVTDDH